MKTINIHQAKEYCETYDIDRNEWVAGAVDKVKGGGYQIEYRRHDGMKVVIDKKAFIHHMLESADMSTPIHLALNDNLHSLREAYIEAVTEVIGNLADDWEIGV